MMSLVCRNKNIIEGKKTNLKRDESALVSDLGVIKNQPSKNVDQ